MDMLFVRGDGVILVRTSFVDAYAPQFLNFLRYHRLRGRDPYKETPTPLCFLSLCTSRFWDVTSIHRSPYESWDSGLSYYVAVWSLLDQNTPTKKQETTADVQCEI